MPSVPTKPTPGAYDLCSSLLVSRRSVSSVTTTRSYEPAGTVIVPSSFSTLAKSSATPGRYSWRYASPTLGAASMMIPGSAPSTPASHVPAVLVTAPLAYSAVSSPKYQTLPSASCAYQSTVFSTSALLLVTTSRTTMHLTPRITFVSLVTVISVRRGMS